MLQVRVGKRSPQAALRIVLDMAGDADFPLSREEAVRRVLPLLANPPRRATVRSSFVLPLVTGLPASPGTASGPIATSPDAAIEAAERGSPAILVRSETSPDDVHGMAKAAGILTSRGGLASHAAVVARGWGIPAVVGASALQVREDGIELGERAFAAGEVITIDGASGEVFEGAIPGSTEVLPEAQTLQAWASELGIAIGDSVPTAEPTSAARKVSPDDCLRALSIKGFATLQALADALLSTPHDVQPVVDQLALDGLVATAAGANKLTQAGEARAADLLEGDRAAWGIQAAEATLDEFLDLDRQIKEIVTAWQLRDPSAQVLNDHSDADYDQAVLDRLEALHADAVALLMPLESACPRLSHYRGRFARALANAIVGDPKFVASPRVDSYHSIWFELHEDLIRLAGRTRADETAAGRA
jgi:pyruvate,orthophosphate dikinase